MCLACHKKIIDDEANKKADKVAAQFDIATTDFYRAGRAFQEIALRHEAPDAVYKRAIEVDSHLLALENVTVKDINAAAKRLWRLARDLADLPE